MAPEGKHTANDGSLNTTATDVPPEDGCAENLKGDKKKK